VTAAADRVRRLDWSALDGLELRAPLDAVLSGEAAERVLDRFLRAHRDFSAAQRRVTAEAVFGVGLWRRRLRAQAGSDDALQQLEALTHLGPDPDDFAARHSLPDWLAAELQGNDALADALNLPGPVCLRAYGDRDALAAQLAKDGIETRPGRFAGTCLVVTSPRPNLKPGPLFEVQDEGSQLLGALVDARPGDSVLDLCAGAGGKALQLAATGATVHACDTDLERLERLRRRAEHAHVSGIRIHGASPPDALKADRVLIDAPCSELGGLRRGPDLRWRIDPATFAPLPALQLALLERGADHTRPGGRLVYATCTFRREENEAVAERFESTHPGFVRERFFHCWPHVEGTDAFFAAVYVAR
jgi:16S rRNA (cytosine967-C5)-methyltransferase